MHLVQIEPVGRRKLSVSPAFMSFDAYCRLVDRLAPPFELHFHGEDEPLLHPRVFDMVAYAVQRGIDVSATTRLPGLTARRAEDCVNSGLRRMHVLLGGDPSGLVKRSLRRLEETKRRLGSALPQLELVRAAPDRAPAIRIAFSGHAVAPAVTATQ